MKGILKLTLVMKIQKFMTKMTKLNPIQTKDHVTDHEAGRALKTVTGTRDHEAGRALETVTGTRDHEAGHAHETVTGARDHVVGHARGHEVSTAQRYVTGPTRANGVHIVSRHIPTTSRHVLGEEGVMEMNITHMGKGDTDRININSSQVLGRVGVKEWIPGTDGIILPKIINNI